MKPVVVNPSLSFEQLLQELTSVTDDGHRAADPRSARRQMES